MMDVSSECIEGMLLAADKIRSISDDAEVVRAASAIALTLRYYERYGEPRTPPPPVSS